MVVPPLPLTTPICWDPSSRAPIADSGSAASSTVDVTGPTLVTRPTSPSPLRTVMSGARPSRLPASTVAVQSKVCPEPTAITRAGTTRY